MRHVVPRSTVTRSDCMLPPSLRKTSESQEASKTESDTGRARGVSTIHVRFCGGRRVRSDFSFLKDSEFLRARRRRDDGTRMRHRCQKLRSPRPDSRSWINAMRRGSSGSKSGNDWIVGESSVLSFLPSGSAHIFVFRARIPSLLESRYSPRDVTITS